MGNGIVDLHWSDYDEFTLQVQPILCTIANSINEESLQFLGQVWKKNPEAFKKLPARLKKNTNESRRHLSAEHVNLATHTLKLQSELPDNLLDLVENHLPRHEVYQLSKVLNTIINQYFILQNQCQNVLASTLYMNQHLNNSLFNNNFLQQLICCVVIFNEEERHFDHTQRPEAIIQKFSMLWLNHETSFLKKLVEFLAHIVVLATTTIKSQIRPMNMMELFFIFEKLKTEANLPIARTSNRDFLTKINIMMLILSVCKNKPLAFYDLVAWENHHAQKKLHLKIHISSNLLIDQFFTSSTFTPYFILRQVDNSVNKEAFFITLGSWVSQCEHQYIHFDLLRFIKLVHKNQAQYPNHDDFNHWFQQAWATKNVQKLLTNFLFYNFDHKLKQHQNHFGNLVFTANKLVSVGIPPRAINAKDIGQYVPLIHPEVAMTDAKNLQAFKYFFDQLPLTQQTILLQEILLIIGSYSDLSMLQQKTAIHAHRIKKSTSTTINPSQHAIKLKDRHSSFQGSFFVQPRNKVETKISKPYVERKNEKSSFR